MGPFCPGGCTVDGEMNAGGGENGGDPGQGLPVTGPHKFKLLAKLIRVNKENDPLSGTGLDNRLFDKFRNLSLVSFPIVSGIGPEKLSGLGITRYAVGTGLGQTQTY